jgi:hypothetical protein
MNMRWWVVLSAVAVFGLLSLPVLAQPPMGSGPGNMGPGPGHMQGAPGVPQVVGGSLSMDRAEAIARNVLDRLGYAGLVPEHIMEFSNNFYVAVKYKATGQGAFEFLIDRYTGIVHPEPQSMMWNTQFAHMAGWGGSQYGRGGMMGPGYGPEWGGSSYGPGMVGPGYGGPGYGYGGPGAVQPGGKALTLAQARAQAQQFLDARLPGTKTDEAIAFPGYYTIDVSRNGKVIGMLSVNAYSGQVWYHSWHGTLVQETDLK